LDLPLLLLSPSRRLSRLLLLAAFTVGGAALLLVALELGLRAAGSGVSPHFFRKAVTAGGETVWRENRDALLPYFPGTLARRPWPLRLPVQKAPGTCRIFILGSSAAMGDPEPSFSLARQLEVLLAAAYPSVRFEVVNAAVTAINSHLVRGIAADCAQLAPDLFIVYEGNNEVIGPYGPAGVLAPFLRSDAAVRAAVWLQGTRTAQLAARLAHRGAPAGWGGMGLFLRQRLAADDPRLALVCARFRANLLAIAASARSAGATTLLCTVPVNERDFAPFLSGADGAEDAYRRGREALAAGRDAEARALFQRAVDLDQLRFRTDSRLNGVIRNLGTDVRHANIGGLEVVDLAAALAARSPHGSPGDEFFYEHVHLNFRGTYEAAAALLPAIARDLARRGLATGPAPDPLPYEEVQLRLNYQTHEQAMIALELVNRLGKPPFTGQSDHAARLARWRAVVERAQELLARPDATPALLELSRRALAARPDDWVLARNAGAMLVARRQPAEALPLLQRAAAWIDDDVDTLVALGWAHRALGHDTEAEAAFAQARALEPDYPNLPAPR
jgi:tetratricopeptide (TPR) repeat protein